MCPKLLPTQKTDNNLHLGFFGLVEVFDDFAILHNDEAVAVFEGVFHVMDNHQGCQGVFSDKFIRQLHEGDAGLWIQGHRMLIQEQEFWSFQGRHE